MQKTKLVSRSGGGLGGGRVPNSGDGGGRGGGGEKVFFDDGQVRVTESLVTIGHPWNKAFAVREITSVTYGKNKSNDQSTSVLRSVVWLALSLGLLVGLAGVLAGAGLWTFCRAGITPRESQERYSLQRDAQYGRLLGDGVFEQ